MKWRERNIDTLNQQDLTVCALQLADHIIRNTGIDTTWKDMKDTNRIQDYIYPGMDDKQLMIKVQEAVKDRLLKSKWKTTFEKSAKEAIKNVKKDLIKSSNNLHISK